MLTHQTKQKPILAQVRPAYHRNVLESIGNTPLIRLNRVVFGVVAGTVLAKAEFFNPAGSIKDRIGIAIIESAEREGRLTTRWHDRGSHLRQYRRRTGDGGSGQRL